MYHPPGTRLPTSSASKQINEPSLVISVQPAAEYRFRYPGEGEAHGGITGEGSNRFSKTFPTVKILNFNGKATVTAQLASNSNPPKFHAHSLVGKGCHDGICRIDCLPGDIVNGAKFLGLGIQHAKKKDVPRILEARYLEESRKINPALVHSDHNKEQIRSYAVSEAANLDSNTVRLKFLAYLYSNGQPVCTLGPIYSTPISRAKPKLKITYLRDTAGCATGGEEMCLLCDKVQKDDIAIRFFEVDSSTNGVKWEDTGRFQPNDVHHQYAIRFKTPPYNDVDIRHPVTVKVQLLRPSDDEVSSPIEFQYKPKYLTDLSSIAAKKRTVPPYWTDSIQGPNNASQFSNQGASCSSGILTSLRPSKIIRSKPPTLRKGQGPQNGPLDPTQLLQNYNLVGVRSLQTAPQKVDAPSTSRQALQNNMMAATIDMSALGSHVQSADRQIHIQAQAQSPAQSGIGAMQNFDISQYAHSPAQLAQTGYPSPTFSSGPPSVAMVDVNSPQAYGSPMSESQHDRLASQLSVTSIDSGVMNSQTLPMQNSTTQHCNYATAMTGFFVPNTTNFMTAATNENLQVAPVQNFDTQSLQYAAGPSGSYDQNSANLMGTKTNNPPGIQGSCQQALDENQPVNLEGIEEDLLQQLLENKFFGYGTDGSNYQQDGPSTQYTEDVGMRALDATRSGDEHGAVESDSVIEEQQPQNSTTVGQTEDFASGMGDAHAVPEPTGDDCDIQELLFGAISKLEEALRKFHASKDASFLLPAKIVLELQDNCGSNCLHLAVMHDFNDILMRLTGLISILGCGFVDNYNTFLLTPLHIAVLRGNEEAVTCLTKAGADPLLVDSNGDTAIHAASDQGLAGVLEVLLKAAGDHENPYNYEGLSPLHILAKKSFDDVCRCVTILINHGYDVDVQELKSGRTPLHIAAEEDNVPVARYLITECDADFTACTYDGLTPLHNAVSYDHKEISVLLLAFGADPNADYLDDEDSTPTALASSEEIREILKTDYSGFAADIKANPCHVLDLVKEVDGKHSGRSFQEDGAGATEATREKTPETLQALLNTLTLAQDYVDEN